MEVCGKAHILVELQTLMTYFRKHVLGDLDALVCLFDPCDEPDTLFSHTKDWLQHMRRHSRFWICSSKLHEFKKFGTREELEKHLQNDHQKQYTLAQINFIVERNTCARDSLFESCPLCGGKDGDPESPKVGRELINHIVGHLRSLALKSLPSVYERDDDEASNIDIINDQKSRSTLRDILDEAEPAHNIWESDYEDSNSSIADDQRSHGSSRDVLDREESTHNTRESDQEAPNRNIINKSEFLDQSPGINFPSSSLYQPLHSNVNHLASYTPGFATSDGANLPGPVLAGPNTAAHIPILPSPNQLPNNAPMLSQDFPVYAASSNANSVQQQLMPPPALNSRRRTAPTLRDDDWTPVKGRILELHIDQNMPLPKVKDTIEKEFSFKAT
jgi:hypothetical protein